MNRLLAWSGPAVRSVPLAVVLSAGALIAQEGVPPPPGLVPEKVWPAPTAEDWARPCLIQWQRTWDDALAIATQSHRPILVCINMDGEIASEHYAGVRYRQGEITALYEPYVCVIASVYRHNPRDYDQEGRRIPCPRFGTVTCGEHIAIEPILFEKFMDGKRISPRHIMVELDGNGQPAEETYDVFYTWDTESVFKAVQDGIANRTEKPLPIHTGDRSILERVASPDSLDRAAVENAWELANTEQRQRLLDAALAQGAKAPVELLRRAIDGFDLDLAQKARTGLAVSDDVQAVDLIAETLRMPLQQGEKQGLVAALERLGKRSPRARTLAVVQRGLVADRGAIDVSAWTAALRGAATYPPPDDRQVIDTRIEDAANAARRRADDPVARIDFAEALLSRALERPITTPVFRDSARFDELQWQDAERAAQDAERLGAEEWRVHTVLALCANHRGDHANADARAEKAVRAMPPDAQSRASAAVLQVFAEGRQGEIVSAILAQRDWPPDWVTDINSAYAILARHPFGTDKQVADHYDFLQYFGASQAEGVLEAGLQRFVASPLLHERLRNRVLAEKGAAGLEREYEVRLGRTDAPAALHWFAGFASLVAAESSRREGRAEEALAAYGRGILHFESAIERDPATRPHAEHYIGMAHGGRARVLLDAGRHDQALAALEESFRRAPGSFATLDGLNVSAVATTRMLRVRSEKEDRPDRVAHIDALLGALDPKLLEPPEFEREGRAPPRRGRRGG